MKSSLDTHYIKMTKICSVITVLPAATGIVETFKPHAPFVIQWRSQKFQLGGLKFGAF